MENPTETELVTELLQGLTKDVTALRASVETLSKQTPPDHQASMATLTQAVNQLRQPSPVATAPPSPAVDISAITARFDALSQQIRQRPEYRMSQYVRYGAYAFGIMVMLLVTLTWLAVDWRQERDDYAQRYTWADWRLRYLRQADPQYYQAIEGKFEADANGVGRWIEQQEQADATRAAARKAAEQAAALTKEANQLEGKKNQSGR